MAKEAKDKEASESSGLADIMEVAEKIGSPADSFAGAGITIARDDDDDDDDLANLGGGFGGGGSAALVGGGDDDDDDLPAVSAFEPVALPSADPEPLPGPKRDAPSLQKKVSLVEPPTPAAPKSEAKPKGAKAKDSGEAEPVVVAPRSAASAPAPVAGANEGGGSKMWLVLLGLAAAGAAVWFFVIQPPAAPAKTPAAAATTPANAAPPEPIAKADPPPVEPVPAAEDDAALVIEDGSTGAEEAATGGSGEAAAAETGEQADAAEPDKAAWKTTRKLPRAKKEAADTPKEDPPAEPPPEPEPVPEPEPKPDPKPMTQAEIDKKFSTECLLDPNKPGCEEFRKRQEAKRKDLDAHLPDKLSQNDIRGAIGSVKSKAKACGSQHGATAGETVRVKLSIEGSTGNVLSASAMSPHDSTPLGKCVAEALSGANFPRFKSQQQGTTYPVTM